MPYTVKEDDGKHCVYKADADGEPMGESLGCHDTADEAGAQIGAIEKSEAQANTLSLSDRTRALQMVCNVTFGTVRREKMDGREYLVAPVVGIRPGVLNRELVPEEEIARHVASWNGRPWVLDHPQVGGVHVSANDPQLLEQYAIGRVFNAQWIDGALKAEVWTDIAKANATEGGREVMRRLESGQPLEVSTAYFRDLDEQAGEWNGQAYDGIARNLKPDHLAALLDGIGACSWADGCGAPRVNEEGADEVIANVMGKARKPTYSGTTSDKWSAPTLSSLGFSGSVSDLSAADRRKIAGHSLLGDPQADNFREMCFFPVVGPDGKLNEGALMAVISGRGAQANIPAAAKKSAQNMARSLLNKEFDRELEMNEQKDETFVESVVRRTLETLGIKSNREVKRMSRIEEILACECAPFTQEELESLSDESVNALAELMVNAAQPPEPNANEGDTEPEPGEGGGDTAHEFDLAGALDEALASIGGLAGLVQTVQGVRANADSERQALIAELAANAALGMSAEQLATLDEESLRALSHALQPPTYVGRGGGPRPQAGGEISVLARPSVLLREEA